MRLRRLDLTRYGMFTDHGIDFGERLDSEPDLHVIYGPNEAGKSTTLAAFLDLLFSIEQRSGYSFLHGYEAMQVGADLEIGGQTQRFVRIRKRQNSLLGADSQPVADGVVANALGGMDRNTYKAMFSLDDDTLEAGGEEILRSEGDLGQLLFAASAGLFEIGDTLNRLRAETETFHKGRAQSTTLSTLKSELSDLDQKKKELDTVAGAYAQLVQKRDQAQGAYDLAMDHRAALEASRGDAQRRLQALPWLAQIRKLREEFVSFEALPEPPAAWIDQIADLMDQEPRLTTRFDSLNKQRVDLDKKLAAITVDDAVIALEARIEDLDTFRARYVSAETDLPERRLTLKGHDGEIRAIITRLEPPDNLNPSFLVITASVVGALKDLIEKRSGLDERLTAATDELETAEAMLGRVRDELDGLNAGMAIDRDAALNQLSAAVNASQADDHGSRLALYSGQRNKLQASLHEQLGHLRPWAGDGAALAGIRVPEQSEIGTWKTRLAQSQKDVERLEEEGIRLTTTKEKYAIQITAQTEQAGIVDDHEAGRLRSVRDEAWATHREALVPDTADRFETALGEDDTATAARLSHATELAQVRQADEALRSTSAEGEQNTKQLKLVNKRRQQVLDEVTAAVKVMVDSGADGLSPRISLSKLEAWMDHREKALEILVELRDAEAEVEKASGDGARLTMQLVAALKAAHIEREGDLELDALLVQARAAVDQHKAQCNAFDNTKAKFEAADQEADNRRRNESRACTADKQWHQEWLDALSRCWLGQIEPTPNTASVRQVLQDVSKLESALKERAEMADRIAKMEQDQASFVAGLQVLTEELCETVDETQSVAIADGLRSRLLKALTDRDIRDGVLEERQAIIEQTSTVETELVEHSARSAEMMDLFGVSSLREVNEQLQKVLRRTEVRDDLAEREANLVELMSAKSFEKAKAVLDVTDRDKLEQESAELDARAKDEEQRTRDLYVVLNRVKDAISAIGGGDEVARIETHRSTIHLEIEERALEYVRIRLGIEAAERALRAYREEHRSSMMEKASEAFRTISRGAYSGLAAQPGDEGEVLMGIAAGGGAKIASEMSKGTRFQLYLSLRVAGYYEFVNQHGAVPFVADDILETFDDFRAEEAFRLFTEMAGVGQVIYLTHHRHLCEIARDVCPTVRIHELPGPQAWINLVGT